MRLILSLLFGSALFAQFPNAVPTRVDLPYAVNNAKTTLTQTITGNSRSFTVLDPEKFRLPGYVTVHGPAPDYANLEIVKVCSSEGNKFVVCPNGRGIDPKMPPAYHKYGDIVEALVNAEYVNVLSDLVISISDALGPNLSKVIKVGQAAGGDLNGTFPNATVRTVNGGKPLPAGDVVGTTDTQSLTNKIVQGLFYGDLHGNADTATNAVNATKAAATANNPSPCGAGRFVSGMSSSFVFTCSQVSYSDLSGLVTGVPAGSYGSSSKSVNLTVDAFGRITAITEADITGGGGGGGYTTVYNGASPLTQRSAIVAQNGLVATDNGTRTTLGLSTLLGSGASYGGSGKLISLSTDVYGRITAISDQTFTVDWSSVANKPGTFGSSTLTNTVTDVNANLVSGTYSGSVNGSGQTGVSNAPTTNPIVLFHGRYNNASVQSSVQLLGDSTADGMWFRYATNGTFGSWRKLLIENIGLTYAINVSGNAGSVTNGVYTSTTYNDPSWLNISKAKVGLGLVENTALSTWAGSGNITAVGTLSSGTVPWARLSGVPSYSLTGHTHTSADLVNGTYGISITGSAGSAAAWTGWRQINFAYGGDPNQTLPATTVHNVWRADAFQATVANVACWTDTGTVQLTIVRSDGGAAHAPLTCSTTGVSTSSFTGYQSVPYGYGLGFTTASVSGAHNVSVSIKYAPSY